jgi:hypothetical protein
MQRLEIGDEGVDLVGLEVILDALHVGGAIG